MSAAFDTVKRYGRAAAACPLHQGYAARVLLRRGQLRLVRPISTAIELAEEADCTFGRPQSAFRPVGALVVDLRVLRSAEHDNR
jgi:hypothetical protein